MGIFYIRQYSLHQLYILWQPLPAGRDTGSASGCVCPTQHSASAWCGPADRWSSEFPPKHNASSPPACSHGHALRQNATSCPLSQPEYVNCLKLSITDPSNFTILRWNIYTVSVWMHFKNPHTYTLQYLAFMMNLKHTLCFWNILCQFRGIHPLHHLIWPRHL